MGHTWKIYRMSRGERTLSGLPFSDLHNRLRFDCSFSKERTQDLWLCVEPDITGTLHHPLLCVFTVMAHAYLSLRHDRIRHRRRLMSSNLETEQGCLATGTIGGCFTDLNRFEGSLSTIRNASRTTCFESAYHAEAEYKFRRSSERRQVWHQGHLHP